MQQMMEQLILSNKSRFGRSSEKLEDTSQIRFMEVDGTIVFFNEAEADISGLPRQRIDHYLSEEELTAEFGEKGWKQLPYVISNCYRFVPAKVEIEEHHIGVYSSKTDEHMVKAPHPKKLLRGSLVSESLAAAIMNGKYVNAVPLYRL